MQPTTLRRVIVLVGILAVMSHFLGSPPEQHSNSATSQTEAPIPPDEAYQRQSGSTWLAGMRMRKSCENRFNEINAAINVLKVRIAFNDGRADNQAVLELKQKELENLLDSCRL